MWLAWFASLFLVMSFWTACSPPEEPQDKTCRTSSDCEKGEICSSKKKCEPKPDNTAPIADPGSPQTVKVREEVFLDGTASYDQETGNLTYQWTLTTKPDGSSAKLKGPTSATPTLIPDKAGIYLVQLVVSDGKLKSKPAEVRITAEKGQNFPPNADAGKDQTVEVGATVQLDGTASTDPNKDPLTYKWELTAPSGSKAKLSDATKDKPTFVADIEGDYKLKLVVNDGEVASDPSEVTVKAVQFLTKTPKITSLDPARGPTGSDLDVAVKGEFFAKGAAILFDGRELVTSYVSASELKARLPLSKVAAGKYNIEVKNPSEKKSAPAEFEVFDVPAPNISEISPTTAGQNAQVTLKIKGTNFISTSQVFFATTKLSVKFISDKELEAQLDLTGVGTGTYPVEVRNPVDQNGTNTKDSNKIDFQVTPPPPAPEMNAITPTSAKLGSTIAEFRALGKRFTKNAEIWFIGPDPKDPKKNVTIKEKTVYVSPNEVKIEKFKLDATKFNAGIYKVRLVNVGEGSPPSNELALTVLPEFPPPKIISLSPSSGYVGSKVKVKINGQAFEKTSEVTFDSKKITAKFVSTSQLEVELDLNGLTANKEYDIQVKNQPPASKPGLNLASNVAKFRVLPLPPPSFTSHVNSPLYKLKRGTIIVRGQGFTQGTLLQVSTSGQSSSYYCSRYLTSSFKDITGTDAKYTYVSPTEFHVSFTMPNASSSSRDYWNFRVRRGTQYSAQRRCIFISYSTGSWPNPLLTSLTPPAVPEGTTSQLVTLRGSYFDQTSSVYFNGARVTTVRYRSSSQFEATLSLTGLKAGSYDMYITNGTGNKSAVQKFTILKKGQPQLTAVSPSSVYLGETYNFTFTGSGFDSKAKVTLSGKAFPGTVKFNSSSSMSVSSVKITGLKKGSYPIVVENPNGLKSNPVNLVVNVYPAPVLSSLSPNYGEEGSTLSSITVYGSYIRSKATLTIGTKSYTCTYSSSSRMYCYNVDISSFKQGTQQAGITNPDGQKSAKTVPFTVRAPSPPSITSLSPTLGYNNQSYTITVSGSRFSKISKVLFDGKALTTKYVSTSRLTATIDLKGYKTGISIVKVRNNIAGKDYDSNGSNFIVVPVPKPQITYMNPMQGYPNRKLTVYLYGNNFNSGAQVEFNGKLLKPTVSSTRLTLTLDLNGLKPGNYKMQVQNSPTEKSEIVYFRVNALPAPYVNYVRPGGVRHTNSPVKITVYGANFDPKATVTIRGNSVAATVSSSSVTFTIPFPSVLFPHNSKNEIKITNPDGRSTSGYVYSMNSSSPLIEYTSPTTLRENQTLSTFYLYGKSMSRSGRMTFGTSTYSFSYGNSSYVYARNVRVTAKAGWMEIKYTYSTSISNPYLIRVTGDNAPRITYVRAPFGKKGSKVSVTIYGSYFKSGTAGSKVVFDGKTITPTSASTSSITVTLDLTSASAGSKDLHIVNPDKQTSDKVAFSVLP
jgi:hypothetical protein